MAKIIYSSSFRDFLCNSECKVAQFLYKIHRKQSQHWRNYDSLLLNDSECNYITFRTDGTISYLPKGKEHIVSDSGEWKREGRQHAKPGKVLRKILSKKAQGFFTDSDFECFVNQYKANYCPDGFTFELLPSSKIPSVYDAKLTSGDGSLQGSCMNNDTEYLSIYAGCKQLQILTLRDKEGLLSGRALVWSLDDNIILMDRVYVTHDYQYDLFLSYSQDKNWYRKEEYKTYQYKDRFVTSTGDRVQKYFTISTDTDFDHYPYIDTFTYGEDGQLNNSSGTYTYNNTDGTREGCNEPEEEDHDGEAYDEIDEQWIDEDDIRYIDAGESRYRGRHTSYENTIDVDNDTYHVDDRNIVEVDNEWYHKYSGDICNIDGDYHLVSDCVYSEYHSEHILENDSVCTVDGEYFKDSDVDDLVVEIDGDYYEIDSGDIIEVNDTWYKIDSDDIVEIDGDYFEKDSDDVVDIDGDYYMITSPNIIFIDGDYQVRQLKIDFDDEKQVA